MTIAAVGVTAARARKTRPNVMRILIGDAADGGSSALGDPAEHDTVVVLEAQVDDTTGQALAFAIERLLEAGALDAYLVPIIMKKGRPGHLLTVLCREEQAAVLEAIVLRETSTFGVRRQRASRTKLARAHQSVETPFGPIRVKRVEGGSAGRAWPEYEDCAAVAAQRVPLTEAQNAALRAFHEQTNGCAAGIFANNGLWPVVAGLSVVVVVLRRWPLHAGFRMGRRRRCGSRRSCRRHCGRF